MKFTIRQRFVILLRAARIRLASKYFEIGRNVYIGRNGSIRGVPILCIGDNVYIGKNVTIEANVYIGNEVLIANNVGIVGRHDHQYNTGLSPFFSTHISNRLHDADLTIIEESVWIGFGAVILSGVTIGRGSVVAAGEIVRHDVPRDHIFAGGIAVAKGAMGHE